MAAQPPETSALGAGSRGCGAQGQGWDLPAKVHEERGSQGQTAGRSPGRSHCCTGQITLLITLLPFLYPSHLIPSHLSLAVLGAFPLAGRELAKLRPSSDIFCHRGVCLSPTSGLQDVIYADLIGVGLIGSSSSHMCWEGARESIKGSLHIMGIFLHLLSAAPHVHFQEPGHSSMRWKYFPRVLTMGTLLKCNEVDA